MIGRIPRLAALIGPTAALLIAGAARPALALPAFVAKEGKPCGYCHINERGGGPRNYRGVFYKNNNLTFAKFDDAAEAKKAGVEIGPDPDPKTPPKSWTAPDKPAAEENPPAQPPAEGPAAEPEKPKNAPVTMTVPQARANLKAAEALYKKAPRNATRKNAYAEALAQLAHSTMYNQSIPPNKRYPEALRLARQALTLNPKNKVALEDRKAIEDVYKQMGRPIPK